MRHISDYSDDRLKAWCIHCGALKSKTKCNRDHVPSKALLLRPFPANLPVLEICVCCNSSFSADEEYFGVFLSCFLIGSTDPVQHEHSWVAEALLKSPALRIRLESSKVVKDGVSSAGVSWIPEIDRIQRVVTKNARGHAFFEMSELLLRAPDVVSVSPLTALTPMAQKAFFAAPFGELQGWPEVGTRMLERMVNGNDTENGWVIVQNGAYRYLVAYADETIVVRSVIRDYLATEVIWS